MTEVHLSSSPVPPRLWALDVGPATTAALTSLCSSASTILWFGVTGCAECVDFRKSTSDVASEVAGLHNAKGTRVLLFGETLRSMAAAALNDDVGGGVNVTHAAEEPKLCLSLMSGVGTEAVARITDRERKEDEGMLEEDWIKKYPVEEEEEDEEEEEEEDEADSDEEEEDED